MLSTALGGMPSGTGQKQRYRTGARHTASQRSNKNLNTSDEHPLINANAKPLVVGHDEYDDKYNPAFSSSLLSSSSFMEEQDRPTNRLKRQQYQDQQHYATMAKLRVVYRLRFIIAQAVITLLLFIVSLFLNMSVITAFLWIVVQGCLAQFLLKYQPELVLLDDAAHKSQPAPHHTDEHEYHQDYNTFDSNGDLGSRGLDADLYNEPGYIPGNEFYNPSLSQAPPSVNDTSTQDPLERTMSFSDFVDDQMSTPSNQSLNHPQFQKANSAERSMHSSGAHGDLTRTMMGVSPSGIALQPAVPIPLATPHHTHRGTAYGGSESTPHSYKHPHTVAADSYQSDDMHTASGPASLATAKQDAKKPSHPARQQQHQSQNQPSQQFVAKSPPQPYSLADYGSSPYAMGGARGGMTPSANYIGITPKLSSPPMQSPFSLKNASILHGHSLQQHQQLGGSSAPHHAGHRKPQPLPSLPGVQVESSAVPTPSTPKHMNSLTNNYAGGNRGGQYKPVLPSTPLPTAGLGGLSFQGSSLQQGSSALLNQRNMGNAGPTLPSLGALSSQMRLHHQQQQHSNGNTQTQPLPITPMSRGAGQPPSDLSGAAVLPPSTLPQGTSPLANSGYDSSTFSYASASLSSLNNSNQGLGQSPSFHPHSLVGSYQQFTPPVQSIRQPQSSSSATAAPIPNLDLPTSAGSLQNNE